MRIRQGTLRELAEQLYPPFSKLLFQMERRGIVVSRPELRRIEAAADADATKFFGNITKNAGEGGEDRNWNSPADIAWLLYDKMGLPEIPEEARSPKFWGKERITAHEAIEYMYRHNPERKEELETIRQYRRAYRNRGYARDLLARAAPYPGEPELGTVHAVYGTYDEAGRSGERDKTGTATGRLSVSNPPLQQIPRDKKKDPYRIRKAFVAGPGQHRCVADLEQLEVRIEAHLHMALFGDSTLRDICLSCDFHGKIAHRVFSDLWPTAYDWSTVKPEEFKEHKDPFIKWCREQIKAVFYKMAYGGTPKSFAATLWTMAGDPVGLEVANRIVGGIYEEIPGLQKRAEWVRETVAAKGGMWSLLGRWRPLERSNRGNRQGKNHTNQAGGSEVAMLWMLLAAERGAMLDAQIHDELHCVEDIDKSDRMVSVLEETAEEVGEVLGLQIRLAAKGGHGDSWETAK